LEYQRSEYDHYTAGDSGWETWIWYKTYPQCGDALQSIARNEQFPGGWQNVQPNNWAKPTAGGSAGYAGQGGLWYDQARMSSFACGGTCNPMPQRYTGTLSLVEIDKALQTWYVGNPNYKNRPTDGVFVQSNVAERYLDHGKHNTSGN
jgi:hypothetical protein